MTRTERRDCRFKNAGPLKGKSTLILEGNIDAPEQDEESVGLLEMFHYKEENYTTTNLSDLLASLEGEIVRITIEVFGEE